MLDKYIKSLVFKVRELNQEYDDIHQVKQKEYINMPTDIRDMVESIRLLRRDVNDLHSILMLRSAAEKIPKKNRIVFIGTGQINENVIHAYIHFQKAIRAGEISFDGETLFVARSQLEFDLLKEYDLPCEVWKHQPELSIYLLESKVVVLSSHLYSNWGDNLLSHCVSNAIKIQLWHGLPAKTIGASCITNGMNFHKFTRLLEDSIATQHICIQNSNSDVVNEYRRAFPYAYQYPTGDCRTDILFNEPYRQEFLKNKKDKRISEWLEINHGKMKVLYAPTYRESPSAIKEHYKRMLEFVSSFNSDDIKLAIKLHVGIVLSKEDKENLISLCNKNGNLFIEHMDEVYSTFNDFDAIIVDYSSIRSDFALTGKPVFLWRFDQDTYKRPTDVVSSFAKLDDASYSLDSKFSLEQLRKLLQNDPRKAEREDVVTREFKEFSNGGAARRTIQVFLDVMNSN